MDTTSTALDSPQVRAHTTSEAADLSRHANSLGVRPDSQPPSTAAKSLPDVQVTGNNPHASQPGWLSRQLTGIGSVAGAIGSGVAGKIENGYDSAKGGVVGVAHATESVIEHPGQIAAAAKQAVTGVETGVSDAVVATGAFAARAVSDPAGTLADTGHAISTAATATGDALVTAGKGTLRAGGAVAGWVADHPLETTAMVGAGAVEVLSVGTATPVLAAMAGAGGALAVHSAFGVANRLEEHSADLSILYHPDDQSPAALAAARQTIGGDTAGAGVAG